MRSFILPSTSLLLAALLTVPAGTARAQSANSVAQTELIRRQESVMRNSKAVNTAQELLKEGKYGEARPIVEKVIQEVTPTGPGATVLANAKLILSQIQLHDAQEAYKNKEWLVARDQARMSLENNPDNQQAKRLLEEVTKMVGGSMKNPDQINPAIDQKFVTNINRVQELIKLGQDQAGTGQFDKAEESFQQALAIDRSNNVAANELKKMYAAKRKLAEINSATANREKLAVVEKNWTEEYKVDLLRTTKSVDETPAIRKSNTFNINQKLKNIVIKNINFDQGTTIEDAASFLTLKSREEDPAKEGVSFLIKSDETKAGAKTFSLNLKNVPLVEALRYITNIAGVKYKVEEYAVFIVPITTREETLIRREFRVPGDFFDTGASGAAPTSSATDRRVTPITTTGGGAATGVSEARKALEARGVEFPEGAVALYSPATGILTVLNTQDQIDYIEELLAGEGQAETLMIKVETRIVEINQDDLNSLTFNYNLTGNFTGGVAEFNLLNPFPAPNGLNTYLQTNGGFSGSSVGASSVSANTTMQGANGLPVNGVNQLLNTFPGSVSSAELQNVAQNQLAVKGFLNGNGYSILMAALNQKKSFNTITAPSVVVLDQATGTINVSREFRFPTTFEAPQIQERTLIISNPGPPPSTSTIALAPTVIPAWPSGFGENPGDDGFAEIGVTSTVTPQIQPNRQTVRLTLNPQVLDFEGFVNYGIPLRSRVDANGGTITTVPLPVVNTNVIKVPVFSRRSIDRNTVEIQDGYTLVMGGLIRENIDTLDEKIPFLGDLPLVGRAFRSKTERAVKKNLMIFVTVRIIRPNGEPLNVLATEVARAR